MLSDIPRTIEAIRERLRDPRAPTIEEAMRLLEPVSIGLVQPAPIAVRGTRMFRARTDLPTRPTRVSEIGRPPRTANRGRLNEAGTSVLYLSDCPATAFAETRFNCGLCCVSEWRVTSDRLILVNGGLPPGFLKDIPPIPHWVPQPDDATIALLREIFTIDVDASSDRYAWSIAAGRRGGFNHKSDLISKTDNGDGTQTIRGKTPFSGIMYPSVRTDRLQANFALNSQGEEHVSLHQVQWVMLHADGRMQNLDIAKTFEPDGTIRWEGRPARFQLRQGEQATLVHFEQNRWDFRPSDGSLPWWD